MRRAKYGFRVFGVSTALCVAACGSSREISGESSGSGVGVAGSPSIARGGSASCDPIGPSDPGFAGFPSSGGRLNLGSGGSGNNTAGSAGLDPTNTRPRASAGAPGTDLNVACPNEVPLSSQSERASCEQAVRCDYIDGSACFCSNCADGEGMCWSCSLKAQSFGCPRKPPVDGESCDWSGAACAYGDCVNWSFSTADCCLGRWRARVNQCLAPSTP